MRYVTGRWLLGLCLLLSAVALADTQVLVYKVKQKALLNAVRASSVTWTNPALPTTGYFVVEVGGTGGIEAAKFLWYWADGSERLYAVADPTTQAAAFLRLGANGRALLWKDERVRAICYGRVSSSTVYLPNAYAGFWADILEEPYGSTTRVNAVAAAAVALRLDKVLSLQANVVHDVDSFVQVLVTGLEGQGYVDANAEDR